MNRSSRAAASSSHTNKGFPSVGSQHAVPNCRVVASAEPSGGVSAQRGRRSLRPHRSGQRGRGVRPPRTWRCLNRPPRRQSRGVRSGSLDAHDLSRRAWNAPYYSRLGFAVVDQSDQGPELPATIEGEKKSIPGNALRVAMRRPVWPPNGESVEVPCRRRLTVVNFSTGLDIPGPRPA